MCNFEKYNKMFLDTINSFNETEIEDIFGELEEDVNELARDEGFNIYEAFDIASAYAEEDSIDYDSDVIRELSEISHDNTEKTIDGVLVSSDVADKILEVFYRLDRERKERMRQFSIHTLMRIVNSLGV